MSAKRMILISFLAALTAIGAFLKIPIGITSITLQFMFTAMAGILLGAKDGSISQIVYILIGLIGFPVFTMGGGFSYVLQPTFGFLLGLIPAAFIIGRMCQDNLSFSRIFFACILGLAVLYAIGLPYMYLVCNLYLGKALSIGYVLTYGMLIYLPGDFLKIIVCTLLCPKIAKALK